jgi:hypothetical protein
MRVLIFFASLNIFSSFAHGDVATPSVQGRVISNVAGVSVASLDLVKYELTITFIDAGGDNLGTAKARIQANGKYEIPSISLSTDDDAQMLVAIELKNLETNQATSLLQTELTYLDEMIGAIHYTTIRNPLKLTLKWGDMTLAEYAKQILHEADPNAQGWLNGFSLKKWELTGGTATLSSGFSSTFPMEVSTRDAFDEVDVLGTLADSSQSDKKQIEINLPAKFGFVADYTIQFPHFQMFNAIGHAAAGIKMAFEGQNGSVVETNVFPLSGFDDQRVIKSEVVTFELANPHQAQSGWHQ